eukprot:Opistho-2@28427
MTANYVIYDTNGRFGFKYNSTDADALCSQKSQHWYDVVNDFGLDPRKAWSPSNYVDCHGKGGAPIDGGQYHILNSSFNGLTWSSDGIFTMTIRVVDPTYSYCDLVTHVGVKAYGAPLDVVPGVLVVMGVTLGIMLVLVASYFVFWRQQRVPGPKDD